MLRMPKTHVYFPIKGLGLVAGAHTDAYVRAEWAFGPSATGNDAIDWLAPLLQSTECH